VGAGIYPDPDNAGHKKCYEGSHFSAYKIKRQGVWGFFKTEGFTLSNIVSIDNRLGIAAMIDGGEDERGLIKMNDITIYGETDSPDCPPRGGFCFRFE